MTKQEFYEQVAEILDYKYDSIPFLYFKRTRWNNRNPGSGRFIGHGIVQAFGENIVVVSLYNPKINGTFNSFDTALNAIKKSIQRIDS